MADCKHCGKKAGFMRREHQECRELRSQGWNEMVEAAVAQARRPDFDAERLREQVLEIAGRTYHTPDEANSAIAEGWHNAVAESLHDGIVTKEEEERLREFRESLSIEDDRTSGLLTGAVKDRIGAAARRSALEVRGGKDHLEEISRQIKEAGLSGPDRKEVIISAWEKAVERSLEDGLLSLDEENALLKYMKHFDLQENEMNRRGVHLNMVQSAALRELSEGIVPQRQIVSGYPFNLMKSEKLIWCFDRVSYHEVVVRRERRGTSQGVSIRVAKGVYYRPSQFRSQTHEWEENVHADTGLLGITTKHIYFHGPKKKFRVRLDKIVSFEPYNDGFGIMRDLATAKPQAFITGDGWFAYNLITNVSNI